MSIQLESLNWVSSAVVVVRGQAKLQRQNPTRIRRSGTIGTDRLAEAALGKRRRISLQSRHTVTTYSSIMFRIIEANEASYIEDMLGIIPDVSLEIRIIVTVKVDEVQSHHLHIAGKKGNPIHL